MTITPMDIQDKEFERSFRGYDIEDVDEFLDRVAKDLEQLIRENMEYSDQINQLMEKNKNYQKMEGTMHNAIVVAQETADELKHSAKREADLIRREAESEAKQVVGDARYRSGKILTEREELFKQVQIFKMRFRLFIEAQLSILESEDWLEEFRAEKIADKPRPSFEPLADFEPKADIEPKEDFEPKADIEPKEDFEPKADIEPKEDFETNTDFEPDPDFKLISDDDSDKDPEL